MRNRMWAPRPWMLLLVTFTVAAIPVSLYSAPNPGNSFFQHNLVSDLPNTAYITDPSLVNPWGIAFSATSPFWISDNGTGLATLYTGKPTKLGLTVTVPPPMNQTGPSAPTGQIFNPNPANFGGAHFIFDTEDGTISAWSSGTSAVLKVDNSTSSAVYKGLAIAANGANTYLYATDFHNNKIDVYDSNFNPASLGGSFTDPTLPAGYAPFGIQASGGQIYVTYALQDSQMHDDVAGPGHGFVDVYGSDGTFIQRLVSMGALNSPWGLTWAPSGFGKFGGDLLVGNFGDGTVNVFDTSGNWLAQLDDPSGNPIVNMGLWGLAFGNGSSGGANTLFFTAGIPGPDNVEDHGLFGSVTPTPEPGTFAMLGTGLMSLIGYGWRRGKR